MAESLIVRKGGGKSLSAGNMRTVIFTENGAFTAPVTGNYAVRIFGGGGGGGYGSDCDSPFGTSGSGGGGGYGPSGYGHGGMYKINRIISINNNMPLYNNGAGMHGICIIQFMA